MTAVFWKQVRALTRANIRSRYRRTWAGFVWVVLNPLIMYFVQSQVFSRWLKLGIPSYFLFLLTGLLPWIFAVQTMEMSTPLLLNHGRLLKSFPFNALVLVVSQVLDNLINFLASFTLVFIPVWIYQGQNTAGLVWMPLAVVTLAIGVLGIACLLAISQVFFRDTRFIVQFSSSVLFFLTPIFYPIEYVDPSLRWLVGFNPLYRLIEPFRIAIYDYSAIRMAHSLSLAMLTAIVAVGLATTAWTRKRDAVYLNL